MSHTYRLCAACARHVRRAEARCPFCHAELAALAPDAPAFRLAEASRIAIALALVSGCDRPAAPQVGAPSAPNEAAPVAPPSTSASLEDAASAPDAGGPEDAALDGLDAALDARAALLAQSPPLLGFAYGGPAFVASDEPRLTPIVTLERVTIAPNDVDPLREERNIRAQLGRVRLCYERVVRQNPNAAGVLQLRYAVDATGRVPTAPTVEQGVDAAMDQCASVVLRTLVRPAALGSHTVTARFRLRTTR